MKKQIMALCSVMLVLSICIAVFGANGAVQTNVTTATAKNFYAPKTETTTSSMLDDIMGGLGGDSLGNMGDLLGGMGSDVMGDALGGMGDALGGIGDALGGIAGGLSDALSGILGGIGGNDTAVNTTASPSTTSADIGLIIPVPAATQEDSQTTLSETVESTVAGETVDYAATSNPYTKPTDTFVAGDENETIKWLQWIFIYTGYGLKDNGITGVLDEDTVAVVKKLQHENKMTVDGNVTEEVIKAAEVLYYQSMLGENVSAIEVSSDATTGANVSNPVDKVEEGNGIPVVLLIIVLVIIWVVAIGGIVLLFLFKKSKMNASKNASSGNDETKKADAGKNGTGEKTEIKSLSDLFEEAEKKDK